jgi:hypothetical protein
LPNNRKPNEEIFQCQKKKTCIDFLPNPITPWIIRLSNHRNLDIFLDFIAKRMSFSVSDSILCKKKKKKKITPKNILLKLTQQNGGFKENSIVTLTHKKSKEHVQRD